MASITAGRICSIAVGEEEDWVRDRHYRRAAARVYLHRPGVLSAIEAHGEG